jgi:hypothetical protein
VSLLLVLVPRASSLLTLQCLRSDLVESFGDAPAAKTARKTTTTVKKHIVDHAELVFFFPAHRCIYLSTFRIDLPDNALPTKTGKRTTAVVEKSPARKPALKSSPASPSKSYAFPISVRPTIIDPIRFLLPPFVHQPNFSVKQESHRPKIIKTEVEEDDIDGADSETEDPESVVVTASPK